MALGTGKPYLGADVASSSHQPVERPQPILLDFLSKFCRRSGQPGTAHKASFFASVALDIYRREIADQTAFVVLVMDFFDDDINRQSANSGDRVAH